MVVRKSKYEFILTTNYIIANSIGEAWVSAMRLIMSEGARIPDDKGDILEVVPLILEISNPSLTDPIITAHGDPVQLQFLANNFQMQTNLAQWGYSYANRLYGYNGTDQIERMTDKLSKNPASKSATITLLQPENDTQHTPCLTTIDLKIRTETLIITATFRSQDIGKKMYGDAIELLKLGTTMVSRLPANNVSLILAVSSAHVYCADLEMINRIITAI